MSQEGSQASKSSPSDKNKSEIYEIPAVKPGTTTGVEIFFPLRDGFFTKSFSFQISLNFGSPAVGA